MARRLDAARLTLMLTAGVVAAILGLYLSRLVFSQPQTIGGPFQLVDQTGATVNESILEGKLDLVYFGYTYCPDVCPVDLANLAQAKQKLVAAGLPTRLVFVSVDPERDTPQILAEYLGNFDADAIGLTGSPEQVAAAAQAYRAYYRKVDNPDYADSYTVDHYRIVYAMDAQGRYVTHMNAAEDPNVIAERLLQREKS